MTTKISLGFIENIESPLLHQRFTGLYEYLIDENVNNFTVCGFSNRVIKHVNRHMSMILTMQTYYRKRLIPYLHTTPYYITNCDNIPLLISPIELLIDAIKCEEFESKETVVVVYVQNGCTKRIFNV